MIINPYAPAESIDKHITLKTKAGVEVSMDITLADDKGRQSAAQYLQHLFDSIRLKMGEPTIIVGGDSISGGSAEKIEQQILYIAAFHDAMFGTFNQQSKLPENERKEFIEIFLLACATLVEGKNILIDLAKGKISNESRLN